MTTLQFHDPWFLCAALLAPLAYWLASRTPAGVKYSSLAVIDRAPKSLRSRLLWLPAVLIAASVVLLSVALARPRTPDATTKVSREGIAIMMVVDRSSSMNARDLVQDDLSVDRLSVVKKVFHEFVLGDAGAGAGRPDDLIGLISFARFADSLCPLTLDHGNLGTIVEDLQIVHLRDEDGTAIGEGLALAVERLRRHEAKSKVAILLTDGVNNSGAIDPDQAAQLAVDHQIKVYAIGAGTSGTAPVPVQDPFSGRTVLRRARVEIDEQTLKSIADATGGEYFRATDSETLAKVYAEIDRLERTKITELRYLQFTEHYLPFAIVSLCLIGGAAIVNGTVLRKLP